MRQLFIACVMVCTVLRKPAFPAESSQKSALYVRAITVRPWGFEPASVARAEGKFLVLIENHSGIQELSLRVEKDGARVKEVKVLRGRVEQGEVLDLGPGDYVLREDNHPAWSCVITIKKK